MNFTKKELRLVFAVVYCFARVTSKIYIDVDNQNSTTQVDRTSEYFSTFMFNLGRKYFKEKEVVYFITPKHKDKIGSIVEETIQKCSRIWTVFTKDIHCCDYVTRKRMNFNKIVQIYHVPGIYIVPFYQQKSFKYFEAQIKVMQKPDDFNPRAIFFVIILTEKYDGTSQNKAIKRIFNLMWRNNLFETTLFLLSESNNQITLAYARSFSPENRCRTVIEDGIHYYNITNAKETNINLFYEEKSDLQNCDVIIGTIPLPPYVVGIPKTIENKVHYDYVGGIEIELVRLLSKLMNFTYKFHKTHSYGLDAWFAQFPNGTVIGILQDLLDHNIDMAFGGFIPDYVTYYKFDYSTSYKFSSISCYVTDPNFIPQWLIFFVAFPCEVWILSVFAFVIVSFLYYLMERFGIFRRKHKDNFKGIHFADFFSINLGMSSMLEPKSSHLRVLFFAWAIYSVHWYSAYTSILFTYITNPPLEKEIRTIHDLKESGLKVSLDVTYKMIFKHNDIDTVAKSILDNHIECTDLATCVQQFVKERNFSVMDKAEAIEYLVSLKQYKVHKLSQNMMTYFVSTITSRGNPVSRQFSRVALRAFEAGLLRKWEEDVGLQYRNIKSIDIPPKDDSLPLSIKDLIGSFFILISGLLISLIVFIIEIIIYQCEKDKVETL